MLDAPGGPDYNELSAEVDRLIDEVTTLRAELDHVGTTLGEQVRDLSAENDALRAELEIVGSEREEARADCARLIGEVDEAHEQCDELRAALDILTRWVDNARRLDGNSFPVMHEAIAYIDARAALTNEGTVSPDITAAFAEAASDPDYDWVDPDVSHVTNEGAPE